MRGGHAVARRLYRADLPRVLAGRTVTEARAGHQAERKRQASAGEWAARQSV